MDIIHERETGDKYSEMVHLDTDENGRVWWCSGDFRMTVLQDDEDEDEVIENVK